MNKLELAWANWRALNRAERAMFLCLYREAYRQDRRAARGANGRVADRGAPVSGLGELALSEADVPAALAD